MNLSPTPRPVGEGQKYCSFSTKQLGFQSLSPCEGEVWRGVFYTRRTDVNSAVSDRYRQYPKAVCWAQQHPTPTTKQQRLSRNAQVYQLEHHRLWIEDDIGGIDVLMNDGLAMELRQGIGNSKCQPAHLLAQLVNSMFHSLILSGEGVTTSQ